MKYYSSYDRELSRAGDSAGIDLVCEAVSDRWLHTGAYFEIPQGHVGLLVPRSSMGVKKGLRLLNTVGVIDADYRGEVLLAVDEFELTVPKEELIGERVAQLLIMPFAAVDLQPVGSLKALTATERGTGGFGSTG